MSEKNSLLDLPKTSSSSREGDAEDSRCPQCGSKQSWGQSSWCPRCGYYPTLDKSSGSGENAVTLGPGFDDDASEEPVTLLNAIPLWMWVALGGVGGIFVVSIILRVYFEKYGGSPTTFSWTALCGGLASMVTAHVLALKFARSNDSRITLSDGLVAWIGVWQPTIADLPRSCRRIWSLIWGATVCFCAIMITGGMDLDWLLVPDEPFYVKEETAPTMISALADAAKSQQPDAEDMEAALKNLAGEAGEDFGGSGDSEADEEPENVVTATIFGFQANRKGVPLRFLFSGTTKTRRQHIATIATEDLTEDQLKIIVMRLHNTIVRSPATPTYHNATWVKPLVDCRLEYDSIAENGNLINAKLLEVFSQNDDSTADDEESGDLSSGDEDENAADGKSEKPEPRGESSGATDDR